MAIDWDAMVGTPVTAVFGEPAVYAPAAGGSYPLEGVFDRAYTMVRLLDDGSTVNSTSPVLGIQLSALPVVPKQKDRVYVVSVNSTFAVRDVEPDGHGHVKLLLNFVSSP